MQYRPRLGELFADGGGRRGRWVWALYVVVLVALAGVGVERAVHGSSDFRGFYQAGESLGATRHISEDESVERYPPSFHLLVAPLGALPLWAAAVAWNGLNVASLLALPFLLGRLTGVPPQKQILGWLVIFPFLVDNLVLGQSGPMLLFLVTAGVLWARNGSSVLGGAALGVAAFAKVSPAILLLVPAFLRKLKGSLLGFAMAALFIGAVMVGVLGFQESAAEVGEWVSSVAEEHTAGEMAADARSLRYNNQSLMATLARTFADIPRQRTHGATRVTNLPVSVVVAVHTVAQLVLLGSALVAAACARRIAAERAWGPLCGLIALAMLLFSPLVWTHYFIWWLPAVVYLAPRKSFLACVGVVSTVALCSVTLRGLGIHLVLTFVLYLVVLRDIAQQASKLPRTGGRRTNAPPLVNEGE